VNRFAPWQHVTKSVPFLLCYHPRSTVSRYVTASAGVVSLVPPHDAAPERIYELALKALQDAKELGLNKVVSREAD
jgi:PleD family two-component response regulator